MIGRGRTARALLADLDRLAEALRRGEYDGLAALAGRLSAHADGLADGPELAERELRLIRARASRNLALLEGSRAGLARALDRLTARQEAARELRSYAASGAPQAVTAAPGSRDRRA